MQGKMDTGHDIANRPAGRLAAESTSFVGRQSEIAEVRRLIGSSRLVTLTGAGGTGKTRLALRVAGELRQMFADGVRQVDLAELTDGSLVEYAVVRALAIPASAGVTASRLIADHLADRELLLVLDNCEHVLDACAGLVDQLLRSAPGLCVLCTSQQPLGMVGETVCTVAPLAVPPEGAELRVDPTRYPALDLFADRAAAVAPGFVLTPHNADRVAAICRSLDGLPLAIELAAAQLRTRSLEQLTAGLNQRFRLLASRHAIPARHARLRDTFDWSYALCSPAERTLWARLSVFAGFELAGATAVCSGEDLPADTILDAVVGLVDKSIVIREESAAGARYRLLETIREYGLDRLAEAERARLRRRHRDWYLRLAERLDAEWFGGAQPWWSATMHAEYPNLRNALRWSFATPGETVAGVRLATALRCHWVAGGSLVEGRYWLRQAVEAYREPTPDRALALWACTQVLVTQVDAAEARASLGELLDLVRRLDDPLLLARATYVLGLYELRCGDDLPRTVRVVEEALERYATLGDRDPESVAVLQLSLARGRLLQGDTEGAAELCAECRRFCEGWDERWFRSYTLVVSAMVALARNRSAEATGYLGESLRLRDALGDAVGLAQTLDVLAEAAAFEGDTRRAAKLRGATDQVRHAAGMVGLGSGYSRPRSQETFARVRTQLGDEAFEAAVQDGWRLSFRETLAYALNGEDVAASPVTEPADDSPLTPRERQVARLIAEGLSNRQIAARLVIARRTAESHVENILVKLGFTSRTQVAAWAARRPLR
jgi:predicted ATPase/DNA-binding NarL/FixJ family response regulator